MKKEYTIVWRNEKKMLSLRPEIKLMNRRKIRFKLCIILALMMLPLATDAQRRKTTNKKAKAKEEEPVEDPRIMQMLTSTQQVMFIDSLVTDRADFMSYIPLSPHIGKLTQTAGLGTFTSEMGDYRLITVQKDTLTMIMSSDFIANRWTEPQPANGLDEAAANPFLMPDGVTLYFAQKGGKSIGGYDIFVTRYDSQRRAFLKAENIGMPFASTANDLFYAIDEYNQLGYFVTDRRQPIGKVCIYTFIPSETRRTYRSEAYTDEQLRSLAAINRMADTWTNDLQKQKDALTRLEKARAAQSQGQTADRQSHITELDSLRHEAEILDKALTLARNHYATASEGERVTLCISILSAEQQLENLQLEIRQREKQIPYRN